MSTSKTEELWVRPVDYINVGILIALLYYRFAKYNHWGKLGKVYRESL